MVTLAKDEHDQVLCLLKSIDGMLFWGLTSWDIDVTNLPRLVVANSTNFKIYETREEYQPLYWGYLAEDCSLEIEDT